MKVKKSILLKRLSLTKTLLCLTLIRGLALSTDALASDSDEENNSSRFSLGKDWDSSSAASDRFSDKSSHVSSRISSRHSDWDSASQWSSSSSRSSRNQKLTDIAELRKHIFKGNLEITPANYKGLLQFADIHGTAFSSYDRGVFIKGWKVSLGFDPLLDLLHKFSQIETFKLTLSWDQEADVSEMVARAVQFYENLTTLDIASCRLTDRGMNDIIESIRYRERLAVLNIADNPLSNKMLGILQKYFPNVSSFEGAGELSAAMSHLTVSPPQTPASKLPSFQRLGEEEAPAPTRPTKSPSPPILPEEAGLPPALLAKAKHGDAEAQYEIGRHYWHGIGGEINEEYAYPWFEKSAHQGNAKALYRVAYYHNYGKPEKAEKWFKECVSGLTALAGKGDPEAQYLLGMMYGWGRAGRMAGITEDKEKAIEFFKKTAKQGHLNAKVQLGNSYIEEKKNPTKGLQLLKEAAYQGSGEAFHKLGQKYEYGSGES